MTVPFQFSIFLLYCTNYSQEISLSVCCHEYFIYRHMKFHELDKSLGGSAVNERINIGLARIVNVLTTPGSTVCLELAFQTESEVCSRLFKMHPSLTVNF